MNTENIELFDDADLVDISAFTQTETEKNERKEEKKEPIKSLNVNDVIEKKQLTETKEEDEEEDEEIIEDEIKDDSDNEPSEEEKELLEKVQSLKELGALFLPDDYEIENLEKALEDSNNYRNQVAVNTVFNQLPDVEIPGLGNAKDLFAYMFEHGGTDLEKFKTTFGNSAFNPTSYNLEKEEDRRKILETYYSKKGFNEVKTKKLVDKLFDDFEDETEAAEALGELVKLDAQEKQSHLKELEQEKLKKEELAKQEYNNQIQLLQSNNVIGGYPISKEEKTKVLNSLYTKVNVGGKEMTDFDYRLNGLVLRNPELTLALSAFLNTLSQNTDGKVFFDLSKFERMENTKVTKNLKNTIDKALSGKKKLASSLGDVNPKSKGLSWDNMVDYSDLL
jgi:hypothetical protein